MRWIRYLDANHQPRFGALPDGAPAEAPQVHPVEGDPERGFGPPSQRLDRVEALLAPVVPRAILGIGLNYRDHAAETNMPLPDRPVVFMKYPAAIQHPGAPIVIPRCCQAAPEVDYEGELAVVLGRAARDVPEAQALSCVLGYTVANDVSARRWQKGGGAGQWVRGKSFDTFCPLGPVLVSPEEIPDPQSLRIVTRLDGRVVQDGSTSEMVFGVAALIAELSRDTTLLPGTVILTGTPAGVGYIREPRLFLQPGDVVEVEIPGIGTLTNPVRAA